MFSRLVAVLLVLLTLCGAQEYSPAKGTGELNDIPALGLGTFGIGGGYGEGSTNNLTILHGTRDAVKRALLKGYRHIDSAMIYGNEKGVGMGIAEAIKGGVSREKFWLTTKLWSAK
jgi:diketogulonate reductase-like aldo/keto reductase